MGLEGPAVKGAHVVCVGSARPISRRPGGYAVRAIRRGWNAAFPAT